MRLMKLITLCVFLTATFTFAADKFVQATKDEVPVYKNEVSGVYEKPIATVGQSDRLTVIGSSKQKWKVKTPSGETGWVEKSVVTTVGKSKTFVFDDAEVVGYLDNPTPVYIIDADNPNSDPIKLDRSFADALRENVDRETVERQVK
jgi:hypothetical protein